MAEQQPAPGAAPGGVPPGYVLKKSGGHRLRNIGIGCGGLIVLIVIIAVAASAGSKNGSQGGNANSGNTDVCSPKPCGVADGDVVSISSVDRNASAGEFSQPEAGNHYVVMQATFKNGSSDTKSENPFDFKLKDSQGQLHDITFGGGGTCDTWEAFDLAPGGSAGPKPLCFQAAGDPNGPLTLVWSPGFFDSPVDIPLQ